MHLIRNINKPHLIPYLSRSLGYAQFYEKD